MTTKRQRKKIARQLPTVGTALYRQIQGPAPAPPSSWRGLGLSNCRHFVAILGDKPWDAGRQDGTKTTVFRYETGTSGTQRDGLGSAVSVFKTDAGR
jgi:hypothetical protein